MTDVRGRILSTGYNGPPSGFSHCTTLTPCAGAYDAGGDTQRCLAVHAEQNALLQCWRLDLAHTMYVSVCPCFVCAKLILQTPIQEVVIAGVYPGDNEGQRLLMERERLWIYDSSTDLVKLLVPRCF